MKILLFGANGQVGWELRRSLAPLGELFALDRHSRDLCGDLNEPEGIIETIRQVKPGLVVNAAGYTAVDKAESDGDSARLLNALAPGAMAEAAEALGAWIVHYSSDYVFDGSGQIPWRETDPVGPLGVYGKTKLEGEQLVAMRCSRHLIIRTSWVYSSRGENFARTMLGLAMEREQLSVVNDQFGAPTGADLLADITAHVARSAVAPDAVAAAGIYHAAASGSVSWHGYAQYAIEQAAACGLALKATAGSVNAVPSAAFPKPARRPHNSRLDSTKLKERFNLVLPEWRQGVSRMLAEISKKSL